MEVGRAAEVVSVCRLEGCHGVVNGFCEGGILSRDAACLVNAFASGRADGELEGGVFPHIGLASHEEETLHMMQLGAVTLQSCLLWTGIEAQTLV